MEVKKKFAKNKYGIKICMCCASCKHKVLDKSLRICNNGEGQVPSFYLCPLWEMQDVFDNVGKGNGKVKKKEYLKFALDAINKDDMAAWKASEKKLMYRKLTIQDVRELFMEKFGSIYSIEK